jgi:uncharacterized membrane protein HdeD (DUF308 family)
MHVNYGITVGLEIHKNWNNFNWKLSGLLQGGLPIFIFFNSDLNFDKESTFQIVLFKLFHIFIVEGIKESLEK